MTAGRIALRLRKLILARDAGRCTFCRCAEGLMGVTFEIDHVVPRCAGGATTLDNLCLCCPTCNRHKAARTHPGGARARRGARSSSAGETSARPGGPARGVCLTPSRARCRRRLACSPRGRGARHAQGDVLAEGAEHTHLVAEVLHEPVGQDQLVEQEAADRGQRPGEGAAALPGRVERLLVADAPHEQAPGEDRDPGGRDHRVEPVARAAPPEPDRRRHGVHRRPRRSALEGRRCHHRAHRRRRHHGAGAQTARHDLAHPGCFPRRLRRRARRGLGRQGRRLRGQRRRLRGQRRRRRRRTRCLGGFRRHTRRHGGRLGGQRRRLGGQRCLRGRGRRRIEAGDDRLRLVVRRALLAADMEVVLAAVMVRVGDRLRATLVLRFRRGFGAFRVHWILHRVPFDDFSETWDADGCANSMPRSRWPVDSAEITATAAPEGGRRERSPSAIRPGRSGLHGAPVLRGLALASLRARRKS
ncbi:uncharacterized protein SOCE26_056790 [Sorangium cellulosum]|uniref:HNH nuclease domain-containing protein n=1 Tax=Sorangium cellulosum TaxID=56 RepID=A0A2L0EY72_SORCE|nr:uncharacterized protein SOCE26_056790 [Sorangium cellulosum]